MKVSDIQLLRDGGTIVFTVAESASAGKYRLQTPLLGEPRPLFKDERRLRRGGTEERTLLAELRAWLAETVTAELQEACAWLDELREWRDLPAELRAAVPLHRLRTVVRCLEQRS
jgi:hypothetical protein